MSARRRRSTTTATPAGYADQPEEVITYVDAHDNETLFDALTYKLPQDTSMADRVRMNTVSLATTALVPDAVVLARGHRPAAEQVARPQQLRLGRLVQLASTGPAQDNGFGRGLPPKADNEAKWPYQQPLLADPALKPTPADIATATAAADDLLRLRFSTPLFRLGSADADRAEGGASRSRAGRRPRAWS